MRVAMLDLERVSMNALRRQGYEELEATQILEVLLYAELRGNDQGVVKLIGAGIPRDASAGRIHTDRITPVSALINGNRNAGILAMRVATETAMEMASESGIAVVGTSNTGTSTGALGFYVRKIAEAGLIGFAFAGNRPTVAPLGSYEPIFGTNPLACGIPTPDQPIVFDMATSAMSWYGVVAAKEAKRSIPIDVAYDSQGRPTAHPAEAVKGALRTFDRGHKSYGLALLIEVLTGPLVGASFPGSTEPEDNWGNLIFAMKVDILRDREAFTTDVQNLIAAIKRSRKLPDIQDVLIPGERGDQIRESQTNSQTVEVDAAVYEALVAQETS